jgi:hypothetical protein
VPPSSLAPCTSLAPCAPQEYLTTPKQKKAKGSATKGSSKAKGVEKKAKSTTKAKPAKAKASEKATAKRKNKKLAPVDDDEEEEEEEASGWGEEEEEEEEEAAASSASGDETDGQMVVSEGGAPRPLIETRRMRRPETLPLLADLTFEPRAERPMRVDKHAAGDEIAWVPQVRAREGSPPRARALRRHV